MRETSCDLVVREFVAAHLKSPFFGPVQAVAHEAELEVARFLPGHSISVAPRCVLPGLADETGRAPWHPVDSPIDGDLLERMERFLGVSLPPLFKSFMSYQCLMEFDIYEGFLPTIRPGRPLGWLEETVVLRKKESIYREKPELIPFSLAFEGHLCFDTSRPNSEGDYPIIAIRSIAGEERNSETEPEYTTVEVFGSFWDYFEYLHDWLVYTTTVQPGGDFHDWRTRLGKTNPPSAYYS